jgi:potassium-dependent mechanosensitive channel
LELAMKKGCILFLLLIGLISPVGAAPTTTQASSKPTTDASSIETTTAAVVAQIKRVEENSGIKEGEKKELLKIFHQALEQIQAGERWSATLEILKAQKSTAPNLIKDINKKLSEPLVKQAISLPAEATLSKLEERLTQTQESLSESQRELKKLDAEAGFKANRRLELPKLMDEAKGRLDAVRNQLKTETPSGESMEIRMARKTLLNAQRKAFFREAAVYETELHTFDIRKELYHLQHDLAVRTVKEKEKQVLAWQAAVTSRRQVEAGKATEEARRKLAQALPAVKSLAKDNAIIAEERSKPEGPAAKIGPVGQEITSIQDILTRVNTRKAQVEEKVTMAGLTNSISMLLRKERIHLPDLHVHETKIKIRQQEIGTTLSRLIQLEEDLEWYKETEPRVVEKMGELGSSVRPEQRPEVEEAIREMLKNICANHQGLIEDYDRYFMALVNLDTAERDLLRTTAACAKYIDENVFWFPSTGPLSISSLAEGKDAFGRLFDPQGWFQVFRILWLDIRANLPLNGVVYLFLAGMLCVKHKLWLRLLEKRTGEDSFVYTLRTLIETLLVAAIWPAFMLYLFWRLKSWPEATDFAKEIAEGLYAATILFLTMEILLKMCHPKGIAERHFKWSPDNARIIRTNLYWLMAVGLPMVFTLTALDWENDEKGKVSLGRIAFIVLLVGFAVFMQRVLGPIRMALQRSWASRWEGWGTWTHYVWFPLAIGVPVLLAMLAGIGYYYTAMELSWRLLETLWLLLGMMIAREMLVRWLFITHRKLAKKKEGEAGKPACEGSAMNIFTMSDQTRKLLDSFVIFILAVGLWLIWEHVIPAMGKLRQINLMAVKLSDLILGLVVFFMTFIAAKNIPGLLEITILPRLPLDSGLRFAITRVTRYILIVAGTVIALGILGVEWSDLQWLIAAMTVGLSFGLQEIFANFVSGLIILFERPMRVGDIVTVGDVSGTVSKIQIRATTITDHDRKELIVPNKEFITGRVVNWTLSDRVLRLVIPVGIGYGSDTDLAQRLLLKAAKDNPRVLENPIPSATFLGFGESAINFELGVFTTVENFGLLRHELNTAINHAFRDAGIQIPFPQQEIHVRTFKDILPSIGDKVKDVEIGPETDKNWPKIS